MKYDVHKTLLVSAYAQHRDFLDQEIEEFKNIAFKRSLNNCIGIERCSGKFGSSVHLFDCYVIKNISFFKYIRHMVRKFKATVTGYIGINTIVVIVRR